MFLIFRLQQRQKILQGHEIQKIGNERTKFDGQKRSREIRKLQRDEKKIGFRLLFSGNATKQPYMLEKKFRVVGNLNNTSTIMNNTFWIGVYPGLTNKELDFVVDHIKKFVR